LSSNVKPQHRYHFRFAGTLFLCFHELLSYYVSVNLRRGFSPNRLGRRFVLQSVFAIFSKSAAYQVWFSEEACIDHTRTDMPKFCEKGLPFIGEQFQGFPEGPKIANYLLAVIGKDQLRDKIVDGALSSSEVLAARI
jgi:hypothetical protein